MSTGDPAQAARLAALLRGETAVTQADVTASGGDACLTLLLQLQERLGALERDRLFLESVVENLPHKVFVKEARELRFVRFNRAGEELLGYDRAELLGKNDGDFFPPGRSGLLHRQGP